MNYKKFTDDEKKRLEEIADFYFVHGKITQEQDSLLLQVFFQMLVPMIETEKFTEHFSFVKASDSWSSWLIDLFYKTRASLI